MLAADGFGQQAVDVLLAAVELAGDLRRGHAGAGQGHQFVPQIDHRSRCGGRRFGFGEHIEEGLAVALQLARADAANLRHIGQRARLAAQHFQQRRVGEDDVGRYRMLLRQLAPQCA
ncbi:hypothetical protein D3C78_1140170 [compost metagenome]